MGLFLCVGMLVVFKFRRFGTPARGDNSFMGEANRILQKLFPLVNIRCTHVTSKFLWPGTISVMIRAVSRRRNEFWSYCYNMMVISSLPVGSVFHCYFFLHCNGNLIRLFVTVCSIFNNCEFIIV